MSAGARDGVVRACKASAAHCKRGVDRNARFDRRNRRRWLTGYSDNASNLIGVKAVLTGRRAAAAAVRARSPACAAVRGTGRPSG